MATVLEQQQSWLNSSNSHRLAATGRKGPRPETRPFIAGSPAPPSRGFGLGGSLESRRLPPNAPWLSAQSGFLEIPDLSEYRQVWAVELAEPSHSPQPAAVFAPGRI